MGFSLKSASETAITLPGAAASAASAQTGTADAGLFADLFAGQLGGNVAAAGDLGSALGLGEGKPASLLPGSDAPPEGVGKKSRRSAAANPQAGADDALLAQMQAAALQNGQRPVLRGEPAEAAMPGRKAGRPGAAEAAVAGLEAASAGSIRQPKARARGQEGLDDAANPAARQAVAGDSEAARQAAVQRLMALPAADRQAVLSQAQQLTDKEALQQLMALSPRDRQAAMAQVRAAANQPMAQARAAASQATFQDAALPAGLAAAALQPTQAPVLQQADHVLPQTALAAPRGKPDVLPSDVRLMFRREAMQAEAAAKAENSALAAAGERQMLPSLLPPPAQPAALAAGNWRIEQPMANTPQWREEFGHKVSSMVSLNLDSATLQVSPEQLGPLDISIRFDQQDKAMISVVAANPEAKDIVESSLPQLAKMLEQSGIQLGNTQVSTQQQHQASQQAQQQAQEQARQHSGQQQPHGQQRHGAMPMPDEARLERDTASASPHQDGLSIQA